MSESVLGSGGRIRIIESLLLPIVVMLSACASPVGPVSIAPPQRRIRSSDYEALQIQWTRQAKIIQYQSLATTLRVSATCFSPEFSAVYLARYTEVFQLAPDEKAALQKKLDQAWQEHIPFIFAAATPFDRWNDFDEKKSVWHISLINDRQEKVGAAAIDREDEVTPALTEFFPYIDTFYHVYHVRFPHHLPGGKPLLHAGIKEMTLQFAGPLGKARLVWQLK